MAGSGPARVVWRRAPRTGAVQSGRLDVAAVMSGVAGCSFVGKVCVARALFLPVWRFGGGGRAARVGKGGGSGTRLWFSRLIIMSLVSNAIINTYK